MLQTASGIEPGKTPIKYRDVQLGLVQSRDAQRRPSARRSPPPAWRRRPRKNCGREPSSGSRAPASPPAASPAWDAALRRLHRHAAGRRQADAALRGARNAARVSGGHPRQALRIGGAEARFGLSRRAHLLPRHRGRQRARLPARRERQGRQHLRVRPRALRCLRSPGEPLLERQRHRRLADRQPASTSAPSSLQAILVGGIAFDTPVERQREPARRGQRDVSAVRLLRRHPAGSVHGQGAVRPVLRRIGRGPRAGSARCLAGHQAGRGHRCPSRDRSGHADRAHTSDGRPRAAALGRQGRASFGATDAQTAHGEMGRARPAWRSCSREIC